jgi:hypothetical protein
MKTTIEIPDQQLEAALRLTGAGTPEEAVQRVMDSFLRERERRETLVAELNGGIPDIISQAELKKIREQS